MLRVPNSPLHRNGKLLCSDFSVRTQAYHSLNYLPDSQPFQQRGAGQRSSFSTPISMTPVLASDMDFLVPQPIYPINPGRYPFAHTSHLPQLVNNYLAADSRFTADTCDQFLLSSQHFDTSTDFEEMFHSQLVIPQPLPPPAAPETSLPRNPGFCYHLCQWLGGPQCDGLAPGKNREMAEHLRAYHHFIGHERDVVSCQWQDCGQSMQRMNVARHIVSRHLLAAANCRFCGRRFSRPDVVARHERTCNVVPSVSGSSGYFV